MFWERFLAECEKVGKKPNPVARELGISSGTVTGWKNGSIPNSRALELLSKYFNCSVDYLLGRVDNPHSEIPVALSSPHGYENLTDEQKELIQSLIDQYAQKNKRK